jgi:hypothetical protein
MSPKLNPRAASHKYLVILSYIQYSFFLVGGSNVGKTTLSLKVAFCVTLVLSCKRDWSECLTIDLHNFVYKWTDRIFVCLWPYLEIQFAWQIVMADKSLCRSWVCIHVHKIAGSDLSFVMFVCPSDCLSVCPRRTTHVHARILKELDI